MEMKTISGDTLLNADEVLKTKGLNLEEIEMHNNNN